MVSSTLRLQPSIACHTGLDTRQSQYVNKGAPSKAPISRMARPTHLVLLLITLGVVHTSQGHARSFTRCQLSRELLRYNFPRSMIPNWVCLIEHASGRTTDKVTNHNNSYTSYGLFQVR
ncbi:hypothetical protein HW555_001031 [Spodoptera exigua]|uniref:lysozyme n=2 Tax=Spodoptera exigua TaxID=7107 RepID=A0A835GRD8_SPOEX|nr:hypothetical protein HW555_001031 [Spodoptera exigua]